MGSAPRTNREDAHLTELLAKLHSVAEEASWDLRDSEGDAITDALLVIETLLARQRRAEAALNALYRVALNGTVCTPPDTWADPFLGGDGSGSMFDIAAVNCGECRELWRLVQAWHDAARLDRSSVERASEGESA